MVLGLPTASVFLDGETLVMNAATAELIGYSPSEISTLDDWFEKLYGARADEIRSLYEDDRRRNFPATRCVKLTTGNGEVKFVEFAGSRSAVGEIWLLHDLTDWKRAEEALTESDSTNRAILETCIDGIVTIDEQGTKRWTPSVGPLGGISKVDSAVLVAASKGNSERGRA